MAVRATFSGAYTKGYMQYTDLSTFQTLVAAPGSTYTIGIAAGWEVLSPLPADGAWGAPTPAAPTLSAVPGAAEPAAFWPASPGQVSSMGVLEGRSEEDEWAGRVMAAADPIHGEIRERIAGAREKLTVLQRQQGRRLG